MIEWNADLIDAIARRRSVIVIGSGVSRNATNEDGVRPETWEGFLSTASQNLESAVLVKELLNRRDYLTACEIVSREMGDQIFRKAIKAEYIDKQYSHAKIHEYIYALDSSIVLSPNFDVIYETYASAVSKGSLLVRMHHDVDIAGYISGGRNRVFVKTHGSASGPGGLIFTYREYAEARTKFRVFHELLKSLVMTHHFLFLGCGIDDPDIRALFEDVRFAHGQLPSHFMTLPTGQNADQVLKIVSENMSLNFIQYEGKNGHLELTESLSDLVTRVDALRNEISNSRNW
jgi:hypothetical protein